MTETQSDERIVELVSQLCDLPGPGGYEHAVRDRLLELWTGSTTATHVDGVGNLLVRVGTSEGPRVLIDAHMDEIGFRVRHITAEGFLLLTNAQLSQRVPQERRYMIGHPAVVIGRGGVLGRGVFAAPSGHVLTAAMLDDAHLTIRDFFVDLGANSRAEVAAMGVHVGASVVFDVTTRQLGTRILGKAMDDRLLLAVMTLLIESVAGEELGVDLWLGATVQEENGVHGALAVAATQRFDAVVALDVGLTGDIPVLSDGDVSPRLGDGPIVVHGDQLVHYNAELTWQLIDAATARGIPFQHAGYGDYGSDGITYVNAGMPAALVATPVRYTHSPNEMADIADVRATVELLHAFLVDMGASGPAMALGARR